MTKKKKRVLWQDVYEPTTTATTIEMKRNHKKIKKKLKLCISSTTTSTTAAPAMQLKFMLKFLEEVLCHLCCICTFVMENIWLQMKWKEKKCTRINKRRTKQNKKNARARMLRLSANKKWDAWLLCEILVVAAVYSMSNAVEFQPVNSSPRSGKRRLLVHKHAFS